MSEDFKVGDTVELISGGPIMTVAVVDVFGVECVWFDGKKRNSEPFPPATLKKTKPAAG